VVSPVIIRGPNISSVSRFKRPYPQTHWCHIPVEDQTNKHLCRHLPADKKPRPPRVEPPGNLVSVILDTIAIFNLIFLVVGSATWTQKKIAGTPTVEALKLSWDEDISSTEAVNKLNERTQAKPNAGI
jgi:hypothetical protein